MNTRHFVKTTLPTLCGILLAAATLSTARSQNTTYWEEAGSGDFLTNANWSDGTPGLGTGEEGFFYINNGGTANLSAFRKVSGGGLGDGLQISPPSTDGTLNILAKAAVMKNLAWTVPTLVGTKLYLRDRRTIAALELG